jgi:hypothetical protein
MRQVFYGVARRSQELLGAEDIVNEPGLVDRKLTSGVSWLTTSEEISTRLPFPPASTWYSRVVRDSER